MKCKMITIKVDGSRVFEDVEFKGEQPTYDELMKLLGAFPELSRPIGNHMYNGGPIPFETEVVIEHEGERKEWRCFHCDEVFTDRSLAREHFGGTEDAQAACLIKAGAEGSLLRALRDAEIAAADAWHALHNETSDIHRQMYAAACRHRQSLQAAEELGYERGLRDGQSS